MYTNSKDFKLILTDKDIDCYVLVKKDGVDMKLSTLTHCTNNDLDDNFITAILDNTTIEEDQLVGSELKISFIGDTDINVVGIDSFINLSEAEKTYNLGKTIKLDLDIYKAIIPEGSRLCMCQLSKNCPSVDYYCSNKLILKNKIIYENS